MASLLLSSLELELTLALQVAEVFEGQGLLEEGAEAEAEEAAARSMSK